MGIIGETASAVAISQVTHVLRNIEQNEDLLFAIEVALDEANLIDPLTDERPAMLACVASTLADYIEVNCGD